MPPVLDRFSAALVRRPLILDGAIGTELECRGVPTPAPLWSAAALRSHPGVVRQIHQEYAATGVDILVANTFRTNPRTLERAGLAVAGTGLTRLAVELARGATRLVQAANRPGTARGIEIGSVFDAASVGPVEDCYRPELAPELDVLRREHVRNAEWLAAAQPDLVWVETINTVREARAAAEVYSRLGQPWVMCFVTDENARLLSGEELAAALDLVLPHHPAAVGLNCIPPRGLTQNLAALRELTDLPLVAYAHIGNRVPLRGWSFAAQATPDEYANEARQWLALGARVIGGCCGTTPPHIAALAETLQA